MSTTRFTVRNNGLVSRFARAMGVATAVDIYPSTPDRIDSFFVTGFLVIH